MGQLITTQVIFCANSGSAYCENRKTFLLHLKRYAPQAGLEPARPKEAALTVRCSTNYAYCGAYRSIVFYRFTVQILAEG